jgi:ectoine hydroxylase-related dioxygenase (phytanoyl-CoA dioxygenase family)
VSLLDTHRAALDQHGYVVIPDVLDDETLERLCRLFAEAPPQADGTQHVEVDEQDPRFSDWVALDRHPLAQAAARHIVRSPFKTRIHGRNPLPGFGQQGLHADWHPRRPGEPYRAATAIWMLDDFREDNGATRVVPGSHLQPGVVDKTVTQPLARHPREIVVVGRAGSVLLFNGHLLHSGRKNGSGGPRRAAQWTATAVDP